VQLNRLSCSTVGRFVDTDVQDADAAAWLDAPNKIGGGCRAGHRYDDLSSSSSSSCGLSRAGRCRSYELAPCLSILRSVVGGC